MVNTVLGYDPTDPKTNHFEMAVKFDGEGKKEDSLRAFLAATQFTPHAQSFTNLGVCYMRLNQLDEARPPSHPTPHAPPLSSIYTPSRAVS